MKEKRNKKHKKHSKEDREFRKKDRPKHTSDSSKDSESDEWVEKAAPSSTTTNRDDWMSMTGKIRTYTKEDIKKDREAKDKKQIDSYNPATSSRELNPYWKEGGSGVPQTSQDLRHSKQFIKPSDDYGYTNSSQNSWLEYQKSASYSKGTSKSYNWRNETKSYVSKEQTVVEKPVKQNAEIKEDSTKIINQTAKECSYLSDEKMNKLAAKIVKAEIMGDTKLVEELKTKLEAAREYRRNNQGTVQEDNSILLTTTSCTGNTCPLSRPQKDKGSGKRKSETHNSSGRLKYFASDDKYDLNQMFQEEKYGSNYSEEETLANVASKSKNPNDDLEDIFLDEISKSKNTSKDNEKQRQRAIQQHNKLEKSLDGCEHCIDSKNMVKHLIVTCGTKVYIALPARRSLVKDHCIITTLQHSTCVTSIDEDVWEEITNYRKMITQFFNLRNYDVVFYETATRLHRYPHLVINCVPLPRDVGDMAAIYFKKALLECEAEWSMNKKVIDLKGKNIRKGVPKGLPYFWIDFGMDPGFAHVIEDQQLFPRNFAEEIIGGMLDLEHGLWKNPQKEYGDLQRKKVLEFIKEWKPFEKSFTI